jgi:hypothetical protein
VNALFVGFVLSTTAILTVSLGVFGAYCAINGILAIVNPSANSTGRFRALSALIPHQSNATGD